MPDIRTFEVAVLMRVRVTLDAQKFDEDFADEFNTSIFYAGHPDDDMADMLGEHAQHIAQLQAREIWDDRGFIEGYGNVHLMGIKAETLETETEVLERKPAEVSHA